MSFLICRRIPTVYITNSTKQTCALWNQRNQNPHPRFWYFLVGWNCICIEGHKVSIWSISNQKKLTNDMLQGSILGPTIFTIIIENSLIIIGNIAGLHYTNDTSLLDIKEFNKYFCKTNFLWLVFETNLIWTQTLQNN